MTTITAPTTVDRTVRVARVHSFLWPVALVWPAAILAVIFVVTYGVLSLIPDQGVEINTGGATFVFFFGMVLFIQAMTQTFPFTLGLSVTRREFYRATGALAVVHAIAFGVVMFALSVIEQASDGFGVRMRMFSVAAPLTGSRPTELAFYVALFALCNLTGMLAGGIYLRWRTAGIFTAGLALLVVLGGAALVITWQRAWIAFGTAVADAPRALMMVALPVAVAAAAGLASWWVLRRASV